MTNDLYTWPSHLYSLYLIIAIQPSLRDWGIEMRFFPALKRRAMLKCRSRQGNRI